MKIKYFIFYFISLSFIISCNDEVEADFYREPKIRVVFLDTILEKADSMKVRINSFNGRNDLFARRDSVARYNFPLQMNTTSTDYTLNYTFYKIRLDSLKKKTGEDSLVTVSYPTTREKSFSIDYTLSKRLLNDKYTLVANLKDLSSTEGDSVALSCTQCTNEEAIIYIYESRYSKK